MGSSYGVGNAGLSSTVECVHGVALVSGLGNRGEGDGGKGECRREELHCIGVDRIEVRWVIIVHVIAIVC